MVRVKGDPSQPEFLANTARAKRLYELRSRFVFFTKPGYPMNPFDELIQRALRNGIINNSDGSTVQCTDTYIYITAPRKSGIVENIYTEVTRKKKEEKSKDKEEKFFILNYAVERGFVSGYGWLPVAYSMAGLTDSGSLPNGVSEIITAGDGTVPIGRDTAILQLAGGIPAARSGSVITCRFGIPAARTATTIYETANTLVGRSSGELISTNLPIPCGYSAYLLNDSTIGAPVGNSNGIISSRSMYSGGYASAALSGKTGIRSGKSSIGSTDYGRCGLGKRISSSVSTYSTLLTGISNSNISGDGYLEIDAQSNLIVNGTFNDGMNNWFIDNNANLTIVTGYDGDGCLIEPETPCSGGLPINWGIYQTITTVVGASYLFSFWVKRSTTSLWVAMGATPSNEGENIKLLSSGWQYKSSTYTPTSTSTKFYIRGGCQAFGGPIVVDNVSVERIL